MNQERDQEMAILLSVLEETGHLAGSSADPTGMSLLELGLDSLSVLEFLMLIDERTGVEITVEEVEGDAVLTDFAEMIRQRRKLS